MRTLWLNERNLAFVADEERVVEVSAVVLAELAMRVSQLKQAIRATFSSSGYSASI